MDRTLLLSFALCLVSMSIASCGRPAAVAAVRAPLRRGDVAGALESYDRLAARRDPGRLEALRQIAAVVVVRDARGADRTVRDRAFVVLASLGERGVPMLRQLSAQRDPVGARALAALMRAGENDDADRLARAVRSRYPEARGAALSWLRSEERWDDVKAGLTDVDAAVRRTAVESLAGMPTEQARAMIDTIADVLRHDPAAPVRAAAARLLSRLGPRGVDALEQALAEDASVSVQVAAASALGSVLVTTDDDPLTPIAKARAAALLHHAASGEITAAGIESARLLAANDPRDEDALGYLRRALTTGASSTRLQAIVAASAMPQLRGDLRALIADPSDEVRLRAAAGIARSSPADRAAAREALVPLLERPAAVALQAAIALAELRDLRGLETAESLLSSAVPSLRATAAFAVGDRFGHRDRVRRLLLDDDASVRLAAARAILAG